MIVMTRMMIMMTVLSLQAYSARPQHEDLVVIDELME
jgi:hypothetical protein